MYKYKTVKSLLKQPNSWTKGAMARNGTAALVDVNSKNATCFCLVGATTRVYGHTQARDSVDRKLQQSILRLFPEVTDGLDPREVIVRFNDSLSTTHDEILRVVTAANI